MSADLKGAAGPTRRAVLVGGCGVVCSAALTACAGYSSGGPAVPAAPAAPAGTALAAVADIPVGGGLVLGDRDLVITQPVAGTFMAFSATCTHQGCTVGDVAGGTINCPCHGSRFAVADGSVAKGPATRPLPAKAVRVEGSSIVLA
jgi:nitrite reductase/ring-hydroxylating ferredoxin subunit